MTQLKLAHNQKAVETLACMYVLCLFSTEEFVLFLS